MERLKIVGAGVFSRRWYIAIVVLATIVYYFTDNWLGRELAHVSPSSALPYLENPALFSTLILAIGLGVILLMAVREAFDPRPLLVPVGKDAAYVEDREFAVLNTPGIAALSSTMFRSDGPLQDSDTYPFIRLRLSNEPHVPSERGEAKQVRASVEYWHNSEKLLVLDGRWSHMPEPTPPPVKPAIRSLSRAPKPAPPPEDPIKELLAVDFLIGEERSLDIAFKDISKNICYAFNNDSFIAGIKNARFRLYGDLVTVKVRLTGINVDSRVVFKFRDLGNGKGLEIVEAPR
jgi:hypothetical protein